MDGETKRAGSIESKTLQPEFCNPSEIKILEAGFNGIKNLPRIQRPRHLKTKELTRKSQGEGEGGKPGALKPVNPAQIRHFKRPVFAPLKTISYSDTLQERQHRLEVK